MNRTFALHTTAVCHCRFASAASAHHDQLMQAATDLAAALDLVELALTWDELDYSEADLIPPEDWLEFIDEHVWPDAEVARRLFSAAVDIARRDTRCLGLMR